MTRENDEVNAAYREAVYNGTHINWRYWVEQMPTLTAGEAARLMSALDPDKFPNLTERPEPMNNPEARCDKARKIERVATREGKQSDTPANWFRWAQAKRYSLHIGFILAVRDKDALEQVRPQLEALPPAEAALWTDAPILDGGLRFVIFRFATSQSRQNMTFAQFHEDVVERLERWREGKYQLCEAAQVLADAHATVKDAQTLLGDMEDAVCAGELKLRRNGIRLSPSKIPARSRLWFQTVLQDDLNDWLTNEKAGYKLAYPYAEGNNRQRAAAAAPDNGWKTKARERALAIIKRDRERDLYPPQLSIGDEIARDFRAAGIMGPSGKPLTGAYIKRHVLVPFKISSAVHRRLSTAAR